MTKYQAQEKLTEALARVGSGNDLIDERVFDAVMWALDKPWVPRALAVCTALGIIALVTAIIL